MDKWSLYFAGSDWKKIADFLTSLDENSAEGEYALKGDEIFARVMSYETRRPDEVVFETHVRYIDIQSVLAGVEGIAWCPMRNLLMRTPYDLGKDVEFYDTPETMPLKVDVKPGTFVALFPHDAHMPQLKVAGMSEWVKKVVVKVRTSLYPGLGA